MNRIYPKNDKKSYNEKECISVYENGGGLSLKNIKNGHLFSIFMCHLPSLNEADYPARRYEEVFVSEMVGPACDQTLLWHLAIVVKGCCRFTLSVVCRVD